MKFSFDSESYRNNLAGNLREQRETDKEGARQMLEEERATLRYKVSENIKKVTQKIKERREEKGLEAATFEPSPEKVVTEEIRLEGSDGIEHLLEVQTIDISDQIPDEVKLIYDVYRLAVLDYHLSQTGVGPDIFEHSSYGMAGGLHQQSIYREEDITDKNNFELGDAIRRQKWSVLLQKFLAKELDSDDLQNNMDTQIFNDKFEQFFEFVTNGAISDKRVFAHVVTAEGIYSMHSEKYARLRTRYPHESQEEVVTEREIDVRGAKSAGLWTNVGGTSYERLFKETILMDSRSERFKQEISGFGFNNGPLRDKYEEYVSNYNRKEFEENFKPGGRPRPMPIEDMINAAIASSSSDGSWQGACYIEFKGEVPWLLVADQIVDPYHGRLIKVREKPTGDDVIPLKQAHIV